MSNLREITKIARNETVYKNSLGCQDLSDKAYEALRLIVKHPGENSLFISKRMEVDKAMVSRLVSALAKKGYLILRSDTADKRSKKLYPTPKASDLKKINEKEDETFYDYLDSLIPPEEKDSFYKILDFLYLESKDLRHTGFKALTKNERHSD